MLSRLSASVSKQVVRRYSQPGGPPFVTSLVPTTGATADLLVGSARSGALDSAMTIYWAGFYTYCIVSVADPIIGLKIPAYNEKRRTEWLSPSRWVSESLGWPVFAVAHAWKFANSK